MDNQVSSKDIICNTNNNEFFNAFNRITKSIKELADAMLKLQKEVTNTFMTIFYGLKNYLNKKISKKRFMKLLQSEGIQRNIIIKIVKDNKEPYTYMRYYETLQKF